MEVIIEEMEESAQVTNKRFVDPEIEEMYNSLPTPYKKDVKKHFAKKFEYNSNSTWNRLFTTKLDKKESPTPEQDYYLNKLIKYFYDFMNRVDKMSFEQIQNL